MSANRVAPLVIAIVLLTAAGYAQKNEVSGTFGRSFVSTQSIVGTDDRVHHGAEETIGLNYSRWLRRWGGIGLSGEIPIAFVIDEDLHAHTNAVPEHYRALFVAPSARVNFFSGDSVSPWVSGGAGYGRFKEAGTGMFFGPNPGKTGTGTGIIQFGAGLDIFPWQHNWGIRFEARDYYTGMPQLNVDTGRSRQHNYYVGGGFIRRF
jgi:hypothetical protein